MTGANDNRELETLRAECMRLRADNAALRARLAAVEREPPGSAQAPAGHTVPDDREADHQVTARSPVAAKLELFRGLFSSRQDVFALRWQGRNGRSGYTPACAHEWDGVLCDKPRVKCSACPHRALLPLRSEVLRDHLTGRRTVGIYPLLPDETCRLLVLDFDKAAWQRDVAAFRDTCERFEVPAYVEISRSGRGAHVWLFFSEPLPAALARRLGSALLTQTTARCHEVGLDSYDRLIPGQDTLPKGGFGNLVALPLQHEPRRLGRSVFVDESFRPHADQWQVLSQIRRLSTVAVDNALAAMLALDDVLGERVAPLEGSEGPWSLPPSGKRLETAIEGPFPSSVEVVRGNLIYVRKEGLPQRMLDRLVRLAAFDNPEFYRAQAMRLPTFAKPRLICCAEEIGSYIALPRGCLEDAIELLQRHGIAPKIRDERFAGQPLKLTFAGQLTATQQEAAEAMLAHDCGVLSAATAFGKTVIGAWLIAARSVNTLVLVHRRQLLDQWCERLAAFLDLPPKTIGVIGGGRKRMSGSIDVAVIQSLNRKGTVDDLVAEYGQVIVDECHHLSAFSFEQVMRQAKARYVVGLTATPTRRDGHDPIITMQCGPIRYRSDARRQAEARPFDHRVVTRRTAFALPAGEREIGIQAVYSALARDGERNRRIVADVLDAVARGRSPLLLTERTEHRDLLAATLRESIAHVFVVAGAMSTRARHALVEAMQATPRDEPRLVVATGRCVGEGFDDARLDTLFLALPIAWKGTLQQYAGRLHRLHAGKAEVVIYDYVDEGVPVLVRMHAKRLAGYRAMGYQVGGGPEIPTGR